MFRQHTQAAGTGPLVWSNPSVLAIKKVGALETVQSEPSLLNNTDCSSLTYRLVAKSSMRTGCFTQTAFGLFDSGSGTVIFNGADEGLPLAPYMPGSALVPWPETSNLISLNPVSTGGATVGIYKNPLGLMQDERNFLGQLTGKRLTAPPDLILKGPAGKPLVINPQTMAFSDNGSWLVAETLQGSFVRINLATLSVTAFASSYVSQGGPSTLISRVAMSENGRFVAIANKTAEALKVYDLTTCSGAINDLRPQACRSHDYWPFIKQKVAGLRNIGHVRFVHDGLLSLEVFSDNPANSGMYLLAPAAEITSFTEYIGLGDSYTSGEGAFDYLFGTDSDENMCHLSRRSYPLLLAHGFFGDGHSVACSGAVIKDIADTAGSYQGQVRGVGSLEQLQQSHSLLLESVESGFMPGYIAQHRFIKRWQPRIATVSIGGNDIGFGSILQNCVMPHVSRPSDNTCYRTYEDRLEITNLIDRTVPRWTSLYRQLKREAPGTQLYAIGYPYVVTEKGFCAINVQLNESERELATAIVDYLNQSIRKAAAEAEIPYIDISQALAGHRLCETPGYNVAVNGLTAGKDSGFLGLRIFGRESYHPNALGHELITQALLRQTRNFSGTSGASTSGTRDIALLQNAPKTGRSVHVLVPENLTSGMAKRGTSMALYASGTKNGLRVNTTYTIHLDGSSGLVIGHIISDADGNINGAVTVPDNIAPGGHRIDVIGQGQNATLVNLTQPVFISASDTDNDEDGIDNITDTCPGALNSRQDDDQDGIDDICDAVIGTTKPLTKASPRPYSVPLSHNPQPAVRTSAAMYTDRTSSTPHTVMASAIKASLPSKSSPQVLAARSPESPPEWQPLRVTHWLPWLSALFTIYMTLWFVGMSKAGPFDYNDGMIWLRKGLVQLLSLVLLVSLLGTALATSANHTVGKPEKVKTMLAESKLYDHFVDYTTEQAKKSAGNNDGADSLSLSNLIVQNAAKSSFSAELIQKNVNTFLDSNYAWLEGKTATPEFRVDLSAQKQTFAQKVGEYVKSYTAGLPVCTSAEQIQQQGSDLLAASCRPPTLTPEAAQLQAVQAVNNSDGFLSNPVITARTVNPEANAQNKPYYEKFADLPKAYQLGQKLPLILGAVSILSALCIIAASPVRRRGVRRVGIVLLIAGIALILFKFVADFAFKRLEDRVFNTANTGQLQASLTDFGSRLESAMVRLDLLFGIAFLLLGLIILGYLARTREKVGSDTSASSGSSGTPADKPGSLRLTGKRFQRQPDPGTGRNDPYLDELSRPSDKPKRKRPPRLIQ